MTNLYVWTSAKKKRNLEQKKSKQRQKTSIANHNCRVIAFRHMNRMNEDLQNLKWNWPKLSQKYLANGLTGARLSPKFFRSLVQILCVVLPMIPLESFQVSATVTEIGILAFPQSWVVPCYCGFIYIGPFHLWGIISVQLSPQTTAGKAVV